MCGWDGETQRILSSQHAVCGYLGWREDVEWRIFGIRIGMHKSEGEEEAHSLSHIPMGEVQGKGKEY